MSEAPETPANCPACSQSPLLPEAVFCHACGARLRPDAWGLPRLLVMFVMINLILALGAFGTCICLSGWGILIGIPILALCVFGLKSLGESLK